MNIVISEPIEDSEAMDVYIVDNDKISEDINIKHVFYDHWEECLTKVQEKNPDTWLVSQIIVMMKRKGWQIIRIDPICVSY